MPCVHEFGIMPQDPKPEEEFTYTPEKYPDMVVVEDDDLNEWSGRHYDELWSIPVYYHELSRPDVGLAWYGITLIPPSAVPAFLELLVNDPEKEKFADLAYLMHRAAAQNKFIIHYGI